jgi:predicted RecA/RadA family phage recombinase
MTQLSAALARTYEIGEHADLGMKDAVAIYEGSAVGIVPSSTGAGYARQLTAGDIFAGFALENVAAASGDGAVSVRVRTRGKVLLTITSVAVTDIGKPVYAADGNDFTLTQGSNTHIGRVVRVAGTNTAVVQFDVGSHGQLTELTDSSGGTAGNTIADVPGTYTEATLANQLASLTAKVNAIIRQIA